MRGWLETYRGVVNAWECDVVDHFTVAYYYDRFSDATLNMLAGVGLGQDYMADTRQALATVDCHTRYLAELRAGDTLHIESGVIGADDKGLRLGHKVFNSASGEVAATLEQRLLHFHLDDRKALPFPAARQEQALAGRVDWDGEPREERPAPADDSAFIDTVRDTVKPWEIDVLGHMGFQFYVHRFSAATPQAVGAFGMTPAYMRENRIGFSTFEFQLRFLRELGAGDRVHVRSAVMHVGGSSMRVLNRMYNAGTGELAAELSQFGVHLDMAARRPKPLPDEIRARGQAMMAATA